MKCPRHQSDLASQVVGDHEVERCPDCEGMWIPGSSIDSILGKGELLKLRSLCSVMKSVLRCPTDSHQLYEGKVGPVVLDLCQHCNGLWLDPGELEPLLQRKPITPHVSQEAPVEPFKSTWSQSAEMVLYGLGSFIR